MSEFSVYYELFKDCDGNGSATWYISNDKFSIFILKIVTEMVVLLGIFPIINSRFHIITTTATILILKKMNLFKYDRK